MDGVTPNMVEAVRREDLGTIPVTVIDGDGIGPEVVSAALEVVKAAGVRLEVTRAEAGAGVVAKGISTGVPQATIDAIAATGLALKGPLETPVGTGAKSANVTLRKMFETYGNVRPSRELQGIASPYAGRGVDLVVVRENVEDLYAGIEHMQTPGVAQCLKIITRKGSEKIVRLAFDLARAEGRKTVHCAHKANIMKLTEGLFLQVFREVSAEYPDIEAKDIIVDNAAHRLVTNPEMFDVIVSTNMNGDILSDLAAGLVGGLGVAPSANIGDRIAMFECVHGSAPDIAGKGRANPTAMILTASMMLRHVGHGASAARIEAALAAVLAEKKVRTSDLAVAGAAIVSTQAFAQRVIERLDGHGPDIAIPAAGRIKASAAVRPDPVPAVRKVVGADIFVEGQFDAHTLGTKLTALAEGTGYRLKMVSNRGTQVFPASGPAPDMVDQWRCRFVSADAAVEPNDDMLIGLLGKLSGRFRWMHVEKLQSFDGARGYSLAQGEA